MVAKVNMMTTLGRLSVSQQKLSQVTVLILVAWFAWVLGKLVWAFFSPASAVEPWQPTRHVVSASKAEKDNISGVLQANVFGVYSPEKKQVQPKVVVQEAPQTKLNLLLAGVVASSDSAKSLAVIANRGKQNTYGVGETVEGTRATLKAVFYDRVIIENNGRDETLMLEGTKYSKQVQQVNKPATQVQSTIAGNNSGLSSGDEQELSQIRKEITENPQSVMKYIRLSQVSRDGNIVGYRVSPGKNRQLFEAVGLEAGDVAISLNGADLTNPAEMGKIWKTLPELTELNLTVERNGQLHDVYIGF
ncbi:type II secretion system protein GspC [Vibrio sp. Of7-15]|uniref:type II secretion system protein GspC n=1 Tax=Vibrio sp. Of7-15 TaxID=2724879 RepID=UPI001EF36DCE|nr:type II secretion system protein GspC [Vibrio sp. Of7-15]MCG7496771.1 type II secretion system protein GspC [Vibrio sp. Of7-15]